MRILVTGGAGFIGSHLVERFLERGDDVFVVDDLSTGSLDNLAAVRHHPKLHLNVDNILNHPMMDETVGKCDMVIHLAAAVGVRKIIEKPVETITTNVRGTEIILDCCHRHEVPLFLASTSEIYGKAGVQLHEEADRVLGSSTRWRWAMRAPRCSTSSSRWPTTTNMASRSSWRGSSIPLAPDRQDSGAWCSPTSSAVRLRMNRSRSLARESSFVASATSRIRSRLWKA
jgi:NAD(P)-dependent dehydrogenase (short-subunit alcohol dehydrogenase family)